MAWLVGVVVRRYIDILIIIITFPYSTCIIEDLEIFVVKIFSKATKIKNKIILTNE